MLIEDKRQSIYAALLRFTPETGHLRERAIDQIVLSGLLASSETEPLRVGEISLNTKIDKESVGLRNEIIQQSLIRLEKENKVIKIEKKKRNAYYLSDLGKKVINSTTVSASKLFEPVLSKLLDNIDSVCIPDIATDIFKRFISVCFSRLGRKIAKTIIGDLSREELIRTGEVKAIFHESIKGFDLNDDAINSLFARCISFLKSTNPKDEELKFCLTQGYYIASLLEMDIGQFNPITEQAYKDSIFFLDTNVLLAKMLLNESSGQFDELIKFATELGIQLRVTRATIDEVRNVAISKMADIDKVLEKAPGKLIEKTHDEFLDEFLRERGQNSEITTKEFFKRFEDIPNMLSKLGIVLDDRSCDEIVSQTSIKVDVDYIKNIINTEAKDLRGWGKSDDVQLHDACHFIAVSEERNKGYKAWFLSRDRTLSSAAHNISNGDLPFCFPLISFLQTISPFLGCDNPKASLVDLFSKILEKDIQGFPSGTIFDLQELKIICEYHDDVLSTPPEQLVLAFDYVKSKVLNGKPFHASEHTKIALALKKYLSSTAEEREITLQKEIERQSDKAVLERELRIAAQNRVSKISSDYDDLDSRYKDTESNKKQINKNLILYKFILMILGAFFGSIIIFFGKDLSELLINKFSLNHETSFYGIQIFGLISLIGLSLPYLFSIKNSVKWLTAYVLIAIVSTELIKLQQISNLNNYFSFAVLLVFFISLFNKNR